GAPNPRGATQAPARARHGTGALPLRGEPQRRRRGATRAILLAAPPASPATARGALQALRGAAASGRPRLPPEAPTGPPPPPAGALEAPAPEPVGKAVGEPAWDGTLPSTFVFDSQGKLIKSFLGRTDPAALERAVRAVR